MKRQKRNGIREVAESELETLPLMGLFVVLIPMLLLSAVFLEISVIDMALPRDGAPVNEPEFGVTVEIGDANYTLTARGFAPRTISRKDPEAGETLREALAGISAAHREHHAVTIVSQPDTRYEDIITVMDISREAGLSDVSLTGEES